MTEDTFDPRAAEAASATFPPSCSSMESPPLVHFELAPSDARWMFAQPPLARIACQLKSDRSSKVTIVTSDYDHIALIDVHAPEDDSTDITTETIAIASAIFWSWWRAERMRRATLREETP